MLTKRLASVSFQYWNYRSTRDKILESDFITSYQYFQANKIKQFTLLGKKFRWNKRKKKVKLN